MDDDNDFNESLQNKADHFTAAPGFGRSQSQSINRLNANFKLQRQVSRVQKIFRRREQLSQLNQDLQRSILLLSPITVNLNLGRAKR